MNGEWFTLDTDILIYSIDSQAGVRQQKAQEAVKLALLRRCRLTLRAVSEFYAAATRKGRMPPAEAAAQASDGLELFDCLPATTAPRTALAAASAGRASYWDALLLATAAEGGCKTTVTEDLADGEVMGGVRVLNPFGGDGLTKAARALLSPTG